MNTVCVTCVRGGGVLVLGGVLALGGCATAPAPADPVTAQLSGSARAAYERGSYLQAIRFYTLALQRACARNDGPEIARCGYNLAASQLAAGQPRDARTSLRDALVEFDRCRLDKQPPLLLDAKAALAAGDVDAARAALDGALAACRTPAQLQEVWLARGELCATARDRLGVTEALRRARAADAAPDAGAARAALRSLTGHLHLLEGKPALAAADFAAAAADWQAAGQMRNMADTLARAGEAWQAAGDARAAVDAFYCAARSLQAQADAPGALRCLAQGLAANAETGDADMQAVLKILFETIVREQPPQAP